MYKHNNDGRLVNLLFHSNQSVVCEVIHSTSIKKGIELRYDSSYFFENYHSVTP